MKLLNKGEKIERLKKIKVNNMIEFISNDVNIKFYKTKLTPYEKSIISNSIASQVVTENGNLLIPYIDVLIIKEILQQMSDFDIPMENDDNDDVIIDMATLSDMIYAGKLHGFYNTFFVNGRVFSEHNELSHTINDIRKITDKVIDYKMKQFIHNTEIIKEVLLNANDTIDIIKDIARTIGVLADNFNNTLGDNAKDTLEMIRAATTDVGKEKISSLIVDEYLKKK